MEQFSRRQKSVLLLLFIFSTFQLASTEREYLQNNYDPFKSIEQLLSEYEAYSPKLYSVEGSNTLKDWAEAVAKSAVGGTAKDIPEEEPPPLIAHSLSTLLSPAKDALKKSDSLSDTEYQINMLKALVILDSIYDSVSTIPYFRTEETFEPYAPRPAPIEAILNSLKLRGRQRFDSFIELMSLSSNAYCITVNETWHSKADRTVFYNSLSAGLSATLLKRSTKQKSSSSPSLEHRKMLLINIVSALSNQIHMVKSIADLSEYDVEADIVRTMVYLCLASDGVKSSTALVARDLAIISKEPKLLAQLPRNALGEINKRIAIKLITNKGINRTVNLANLVPFFAELITGFTNAKFTYVIGKAAKSVFCPMEKDGVEETVKKDEL